ncbi:PREDICTED: GATA zinc finger domain-containing protein 4-like [Cyphomyrmex costatus]|uniref:GATA zinc finger domain-containing protein 4-like n=1 Tax=Cyphomyrmex costatus TaxID=456900 RepID=UPI0008522D7B|nr:PREDICTED: GATA zinc finger domain-containing protein 4-like [Cyphomyrmex costatus]
MTNLQIKRAPPSIGYSNFQRNYSSNDGKQNKLSCTNVADKNNDNDIHLKSMPSMPLPKYTSLQKNFSSNDDKENNLPRMNVTISDESNDNDVHIKSMPLARYSSLQKNCSSNDDTENNLPCMNVATYEKNNNDVCVKNMLPSARYSSQKNFGSNGNQNNLSSVASSIEQSSADINSDVDSRQYAFKELSPKSGNSERAVSQILSPSTEFKESNILQNSFHCEL